MLVDMGMAGIGVDDGFTCAVLRPGVRMHTIVFEEKCASSTTVYRHEEVEGAKPGLHHGLAFLNRLAALSWPFSSFGHSKIRDGEKLGVFFSVIQFPFFFTLPLVFYPRQSC